MAKFLSNVILFHNILARKFDVLIYENGHNLLSLFFIKIKFSFVKIVDKIEIEAFMVLRINFNCGVLY